MIDQRLLLLPVVTPPPSPGVPCLAVAPSSSSSHLRIVSTTRRILDTVSLFLPFPVPTPLARLLLLGEVVVSPSRARNEDGKVTSQTRFLPCFSGERENSHVVR